MNKDNGDIDIDVLHENSFYEIATEFSKVASILAVIPATSCSGKKVTAP